MKIKNQILLLWLLAFSLSSSALSAQQNFKKLDQLTRSYFEKRNLDTAIIYGERTLTQAEKELGKSDTNYTNTLSLLVEIYYSKGDFSSALKYGLLDKDARNMAPGEKTFAYVTSLCNLGWTYSSMGNYTAAQSHFFEGLQIEKAAHNESQPNYVKCLRGLANSYMSLGDYANAEPLLLEVVAIKKRVNGLKHPDYASAINALGLLYQTIGNYESAEALYLEAIKLREELYGEKNAKVLSSINNLASLYYFTGNYDEAEVLFLKIITNAKEVVGETSAEYAGYLNNLGFLYQTMGKYDAAEPLLLQAGKIKQGSSGGKLVSYYEGQNNLAILYRNMGNYAAAEPLFVEYSKINELLGERHPYYAQALNNLGVLYKNMVNYEAAEPLILQSISIVNHNMQLLFPTQSEKEKELYFKTQSLFYASLYSLAILRKTENPSITQEVYNNIIHNKGLLLKSSTAMKERIIGSKDTILINKYNNWVRLNKQLARLYSTPIDQRKEDPLILEKQTNELEKSLVKSSRGFNEINNLQKANWENIQKALKPNEAAIEFVHFKEGKNEYLTTYCALIITPKCKYPEMISLFEEKQLTAILGDYQGNNYNYINSVYGNKTTANTKLYDLIWKPLELPLKGIKTVYVSPSGLLHRVSFAALCKKKDVYLCDTYKVNVLSSTIKVASPEYFDFNDSVLTSIYGGVDYNRDSSKTQIWTYLGGTKTEAEKIATTLTNNKLKVSYFNGKDASEDAFKKSAGESNIIHIATHGFFYPDPLQELELKKNKLNTSSGSVPATTNTQTEGISFRGNNDGFGLWSFVKNKNPLMRSGLVLAGANDVWNIKYKAETEEDGVLTAQEVATLDLQKTGLVVLSACETGLGDIKGSEGVYGLQRSFKMAGVKYIVMSLWQVPDKETSEFMTSFYNNLTKEKNIKSSFTATQLEMRKKYDPYFWAAFVLIE